MKGFVRREPVIVAFVAAAAGVLAAFGVDVSNDLLENAIDGGSIVLVLYSMVKARSKVTPTE